MNQSKRIGLLIGIMTLSLIAANVHAASWSGSVTTNTTSWSINRESATVGLNLDSSVEGEISPIVGPGGRILSAYHSYYSNVDANDVRLSERTSALVGRYSAEEVMRLRAESEKAVNLTIIKPAEGNWIITFIENWPVTLNASKTIDYTGEGINNRDFAGNNLDYAGMNFLYNQELSKDRVANLQLERMNATVVATNKNETIISADFMPTKYLGYEITSHSTGIADLKYKQKSSEYDFQRSDYVTVSEGMERYVGTYDIDQKIEMRSVYVNTEENTSWLSCCFGGYQDMDAKDTTWIEPGVFDCTCFDVPEEAEF